LRATTAVVANGTSDLITFQMAALNPAL